MRDQDGQQRVLRTASEVTRGGLMNKDGFVQFFDPVLGREEIDRFQRKFEQNGFLRPVVIFDTSAQKRKYDELQSGIDQADEHNKAYKIVQVETTDAAVAVMVYALQAGRELHVNQLLDRRLRLLGNIDYNTNAFVESTEMTRFVESGTVLARHGGVALIDFVQDYQKKRPPYTPFYRFMVDSISLIVQEDYNQIQTENTEALWQEFPLLAKERGMMSTQYMQALIANTPEGIQACIPRASSSTETEIIKSAQRLAEGVKRIRTEIGKEMLNPNSPDFVPLHDALEGYLPGTRFESVSAMWVLATESTQVRKLYRGATRQAAEGIEPDRMGRLATSMRNFLDEDPVKEMPVSDDLAEVLEDTEKETKVPADYFSQVSALTRDLSKTRERNFDVDVKALEWGNLIPPQQATVRFNQGNPGIFTIKLNYQNEYGEDIDVAIDVNAKKKTFDWDFLEEPDEPKMKTMKNAAMAVSINILSGITAEIAAKRAAKDQARTKEKESKPTQARKIEFDYEAYKINKETEDDLLEPRKVSTISATIDETAEAIVSGEAQRIILVPEGEALEEVFERLSQEHTQDAIDAIKDFNEQGLGEFKKLRRGKGEEPLWSLRFSTGTPKGARIICFRHSSKPGVVRYAAQKADYRGNAFRNL